MLFATLDQPYAELRRSESGVSLCLSVASHPGAEFGP
jgi:hypothetical protein